MVAFIWCEGLGCRSDGERGVLKDSGRRYPRKLVKVILMKSYQPKLVRRICGSVAGYL